MAHNEEQVQDVQEVEAPELDEEAVIAAQALIADFINAKASGILKRENVWEAGRRLLDEGTVDPIQWATSDFATAKQRAAAEAHLSGIRLEREGEIRDLKANSPEVGGLLLEGWNVAGRPPMPQGEAFFSPDMMSGDISKIAASNGTAAVAPTTSYAKDAVESAKRHGVAALQRKPVAGSNGTKHSLHIVDGQGRDIGGLIAADLRAAGHTQRQSNPQVIQKHMADISIVDVEG